MPSIGQSKIWHRLLSRVRPSQLAVLLKHLTGVRREVIQTADGRFCVDPVSHFGRCLIDLGSYDVTILDTIRRHLPRDGVFVDLGANEGYFSVVGSHIAGVHGRVLAIEPQERLIPVLRTNLTLNDISNVEIENSAISDHDGTGSLYLAPTTNTGATSLKASGRMGDSVQAIALKTLSRVLDEHRLEHIDLMKIDIEGWEYEAVIGSAQVFQSGRIKVIALDYHLNELAARGRSASDIDRLLCDAGYQQSSEHENTVYIRAA